MNNNLNLQAHSQKTNKPIIIVDRRDAIKKLLLIVSALWAPNFDLLSQEKLTGLGEEIRAIKNELERLAPELEEASIDRWKFEEFLSNLSKNESELRKKINSYLQTLFENLGKTYKKIPENEAERKKFTDAWVTINNLKTNLAEESNLLIAIRLILKLKKQFREESVWIDVIYLWEVIDYIDKNIDTFVNNIKKGSKEFWFLPSKDLEELEATVKKFQWLIEEDWLINVATPSDEIEIVFNSNNGWQFKINQSFSKEAKWDLKLEEDGLLLSFNEAIPTHVLRPNNQLKIPEKKRKINLKIEWKWELKKWTIIPIILYFYNEKWETTGTVDLQNGPSINIEIPKWSRTIFYEVGVLRNNATGNYKLNSLKLKFR